MVFIKVYYRERMVKLQQGLKGQTEKPGFRN